MARHIRDQATQLDAVVQDTLGLEHLVMQLPVQEARLRALAFSELGSASPTLQPAAFDDSLLLSRCALPPVSGVSSEVLFSEMKRARSDLSVFWMSHQLPMDQLVPANAVSVSSKIGCFRCRRFAALGNRDQVQPPSVRKCVTCCVAVVGLASRVPYGS